MAAFLAGCGDDSGIVSGSEQGSCSSGENDGIAVDSELDSGDSAVKKVIYFGPGKGDLEAVEYGMSSSYIRRSSSSFSEKPSSSSVSANSSSSMSSSSESSSSSLEGYSSSNSSSSAKSSSSSSPKSSSSSANLSGSSSSTLYNFTSKEEIFNPAISYGEMTDPRDGKKYRTVNVYEKTWMAENLNFADSSLYPAMEGGNHCIDDDDYYCDLVGRLYNKAAAMNNSTLGEGTVQGICPDGWHIPSTLEVYELTSAADDKPQNIRSARGWGTSSHPVSVGKDVLGMSFVGTESYDHSFFRTEGLYEKMWVNSAVANNVYFLIRGEEDEMYINNFNATVFCSVRCVKDE